MAYSLGVTDAQLLYIMAEAGYEVGRSWMEVTTKTTFPSWTNTTLVMHEWSLQAAKKILSGHPASDLLPPPALVDTVCGEDWNAMFYGGAEAALVAVTQQALMSNASSGKG